MAQDRRVTKIPFPVSGEGTMSQPASYGRSLVPAIERTRMSGLRGPHRQVRHASDECHGGRYWSLAEQAGR